MTEPVGPLGLRVGQRARRTQTITAREVELYAQITGDRNPLHFDEAFARRTRFGRLVAQGGIASGMLNALVAMDLPGPGTVFMSQTLSYKAPTYLGDTLTAEIEVLALKADKPVCQLRAVITNQDGTVLLEGECWTYTLRRPEPRACDHERTVIIGVPREIKPGEQRVALTPAGVRALVEAGHRVVIERDAGSGSSFRDEEYAREGAGLAAVDAVWAQAELILKVKEPLEEEYPRLRSGQVLFTYLHLAPMPALTRALQQADVIAIAYETVQRADSSLPLLAPMSEVAGRLAVQEGAFYLAKAHGGRGILLAGVPGVPPGNVAVLGGGIVGVNAARIALGLGADVSILDINVDRLRAIDDLFHGRVITLMSNSFNIDQVLRRADLLVGAVLVTGARAPVLVTKEMVATMKEGSVIVDVAVDQGGSVETIHPTTLLDPTYVVSGVVHYGVANMPALVPRTSTFALTNATLPYVLELAGRGVAVAVLRNPALGKGVNVWRGRITHPAVAQALNERATPLAALLPSAR